MKEGDRKAEPSLSKRRVLRLVHHHPGRIRMRADAFLGSEQTVERVIGALGGVPGVASVEHNPRTGSLLVTYAPGLIDPDAILSVAAESAGLDEIRDEMNALPTPGDPGKVVVDVVRGLDRVARELTGGRADLPFLVPSALAGLAVYSFVKDANGPRVPRWDNLAWWAYSVFVQWQRTRNESRDSNVSEVNPS